MKTLFFIIAVIMGALSIGQINLGSLEWALFFMSASMFAFYLTFKQYTDEHI